MKKTAIYVIILLAFVAIFKDRIGFKKEVTINGLTSMTANVGATEAHLIGDTFTFEQALTACPEGYRLPTRAEVEALSKNHSATVMYNGVAGRWFTGNELYSPSAPAVFLPRTYLDSRFDSGYYWTATTYDKNHAYVLVFNAKNVNVTYIDRGNKVPVRCVK